jgi:hypothetical protein
MESAMKKTAGILVAVCLCLVVALPAHAKKITVTNAEDSGPGSMRQAILDAIPGAEIRFSSGLNGECIRLQSPLVIDKQLTIVGRGAEKTVVCGYFRSALLRNDNTTVVSHLTLMNLPGGAIWNLGSLTLENTVLRNLRYGIVNDGTLTVAGCTIRDLSGGWPGEGFYAGVSNFGTAVVTDSTIRDNEYIGIDNHGGDLTASNIVVSGHHYGFGIGVANYDGGTLSMTHSTVSGNYEGVFNQETESTVSMAQVTVSGNDEGIDSSYGAITSVTHATVTANQVGINLSPYGTTTVTIDNSVVGGNELDCQPFADTILSLGYNLDSDGTCSLTEPTDLSNTNPMLGPLADNGGPTQTHALLWTSPAIDAGSCGDMTTDQRGMPCPMDFLTVPNADDGCDIGSFEASFPVPMPIE